MIIKKYCIFLFLIIAILITLNLGAQENESQIPSRKIEPAMFEENTNIIFIEGEDAVSTNFNKEPILNYSCSGQRTIQLNRTKEQSTGYYANFVMYVDKPGTYELWYGGTPPGPHDDIHPSFSSPFSYSLDNSEPEAVYREDLSVVEEYAPSYYWCLISEIEMDAGQHVINFKISEKRKYDGKYYFYLDCFFLLRKEDNKRMILGDLPKVFPKDMNNRSIDYPFRTIEDYQIIIRDDPELKNPYIKLSSIYTLLGDYLNALKYLKRASLIDPEDMNVILLIAKNLIWKGDITEGLKTYRELLLKEPDKLDIWTEAGKIAAWTGRYEDSVSFFQNALNQFPNELNLLVNLGLTHMWSGDVKNSDEILKKAETIASDEYQHLKELAGVYLVNGYPEKGINVYKKTIKKYPEYLEPYLLLEAAYFNTGRKDDAEKVNTRIRETFISSEKLEQCLEIFHEKQGMKERIIVAHEEQLAGQPDNLDLRERLAQAYFWNGERQKAIDEYMNIIVNHAFISLNNMDQNSINILDLLDRSHLYLTYFTQIPQIVKEIRKDIPAQEKIRDAAAKAYEQFLEKVRKAKEKGEELPSAEGEDPQDRLKTEEQKLISLTLSAGELIDQFNRQINLYDEDIKGLDEIIETEEQEQELFYNITKAIHWEWNRKEFIQELQIAESRGLILAKYVLAKIHLIENHPSNAENLFVEAAETGIKIPEYEHGLFETLIRQGKIDEMTDLYNRIDPKTLSLYPYLIDLDELVFSLKSAETPSKESLKTENIGNIEGIDSLLTGLNAIEKQAQEQKKYIEKNLAVIHKLLEYRMIRSFYYFQESTFVLRNELGDFYLQKEELDQAIRQFRAVLSIDPWDISAVFRLGQVYQWNGNWHQALKNYLRVYYMDPLYENVTRKYNRIARQYADSLKFSAYTLADTSRIQFHGQASFTSLLNSILGIEVQYKADTMRIYKPHTLLDPSTHLVQELSFSMPLDLYFMKVKFTPTAGACFLNNLYEEDTVSGLPDEMSVFDLIGYERLEPHFGIKTSINLGSYIFINGTYNFERQPETFAQQRDRIFRHRGELDINTALSFTDLPVIHDSSLRTYGQIEYLTDENLILTASQEIYLGLLDLRKPSINIKLLGNFLYQDSQFANELNYYSPEQVILASGGLLASTWLPVGEENGLGLSFRSSGGSYMEKITSPDDIRKRFQMNFDCDINFYKGDAVYFMGASFSSTYRYFPEDLTEGPWDYWSLVLRLGYSGKLPRLLTP